MRALKVVGAVLAAGSSRRLGQPKQLVRWRGKSLLQHTLAALVGCDAQALAVVLADEQVAREVPDDIERLGNREHHEGIASSIRCAVAWAAQREADGLLLTVCDQPALSAAHLNTLCARLQRPEQAIASRYGGKLAVPALFGNGWFSRLATLRGESGAGFLLRDDPLVIGVDWPQGADDIDTPEDLVRLGLGP